MSEGTRERKRKRERERKRKRERDHIFVRARNVPRIPLSSTTTAAAVTASLAQIAFGLKPYWPIATVKYVLQVVKIFDFRQLSAAAGAAGVGLESSQRRRQSVRVELKQSWSNFPPALKPLDYLCRKERAQ